MKTDFNIIFVQGFETNNTPAPDSMAEVSQTPAVVDRDPRELLSSNGDVSPKLDVEKDSEVHEKGWYRLGESFRCNRIRIQQ